MNGSIELHVNVKGARLRRKYIESCARYGIRYLKHPLGYLNLVIIGDREMKRLHKEYMQDGSTTDVLTFDLTERDTRKIDGEIYICLDQARRQAEYYNVGLNQEIARLAVHGVLHLAGYRDKTLTQKKHMRRPRQP